MERLTGILNISDHIFDQRVQARIHLKISATSEKILAELSKGWNLYCMQKESKIKMRINKQN